MRTGKEQGIQQGIQQGETRRAHESARKMLAKGLDIALIEECTGLLAEEIAILKELPER